MRRETRALPPKERGRTRKGILGDVRRGPGERAVPSRARRCGGGLNALGGGGGARNSSGHYAAIYTCGARRLPYADEADRSFSRRRTPRRVVETFLFAGRPAVKWKNRTRVPPSRRRRIGSSRSPDARFSGFSSFISQTKRTAAERPARRGPDELFTRRPPIVDDLRAQIGRTSFGSRAA